MKSKARRGFDALLAQFPEAEMAQAWNQDEAVLEKTMPHPEVAARLNISPEPGPWTCVDLIVDGELARYAIWNRTGNVYRIGSDGAVEDDPFITHET